MKKYLRIFAKYTLVFFAILICAQVCADEAESSRTSQNRRLINQVTQGHYEKFKGLEPENIILRWAEELRANNHQKEASDLLMRVINAQEEKYGLDDLRVAASYKLLADIDFRFLTKYKIYAYCNSLVIQQLNKGYYNVLTAATLGDFANRILFNEGRIKLESLSDYCQQLNGLRRLSVGTSFEQSFEVAKLAEKQWISNTGEWIEIFDRDFGKPISTLPWYRQRIARKPSHANAQKLKLLVKQNLEEFQEQIYMHFGDFLEGKQNLFFSAVYINRVNRVPDTLVLGNCRSLKEAELRKKDELMPGQIEASPLKCYEQLIFALEKVA